MSDQLLSGNISFAGLGSGTDFGALVEGLVKIEQRKVIQLESWKNSWSDKVAQFQALNTKLLSLSTSLESMNTFGKFLVKNAESSNQSAFTATAGADASEGTYNINVLGLAKNSIWSSNAVSSATDDIVTGGVEGTLSFEIDGKTVTASISKGQTLNDLASAINASADNKYKDGDGIMQNYVRATVVMTNTDPAQHVLQISALDQGTKYEISNITPTDLDLGFPDNATQKAADAEVAINGLIITRSSNVMDNVLPGITLNLKQAELGEATLTVNTDTEGIKEHVRTFVSTVNEVRSMLKELTQFDDTYKSGSILTGNYGIQFIDQNLKNIVAQAGPGFTYYNDELGQGDLYSSLSQLGILTQASEGGNSGLLQLDEDKLNEALTRSTEAVALLFSASSYGVTNSPAFTFMSDTLGKTRPDTYKVSYEGNGSGVSGSVTINGTAYAFNTETGEVTCNDPSKPEYGLVIRINDYSSGDHTGTVSVKKGKVNELIDELKRLTNTESGPLAILENNYVDIMNNIDKKIEYEERRISRYERQMKDRFARLDALLNHYSGISAGLQSQIVSMLGES